MVPDAVAGYSAGQTAALFCAGVVDIETALRIAVMRGRILQQTADAGRWRMIAVGGVQADKLADSLADQIASGMVAVAAWNASDHVALTGAEDAVRTAEARAVRIGASVAEIDAAGPWHSSYSHQAAEAIAVELRKFAFRPPRVPIWEAAKGRVQNDPEALRTLLARQISLPIRWISVLEGLRNAGLNHALEVGPGRTLTGFVRRNWPLGWYEAAFLERESGAISTMIDAINERTSGENNVR